MAKINVLEPSVYNKIAAGEVVEKPASVVKELVENSIDAGSTSIRVEITGGGIESIVVSDNGHGIEKEFLREAFMPHATSKIATADDLNNIFTLGFRGEALASIASVSKVTLNTKVESEDVGYTISVNGGEYGKIVECGMSNGTTMIVEDLFYNVPARAKFLRKPKSEEQDITNIITRFVLANPGVSFKYFVDNKLIINSPGGSLKDALYAVYGKECINYLLPVELERHGVVVSGFIARPEYAKPNRTYQTLLINGRYVINSTVSAAVTNAYGETIMKKRYPFYCLNLTIPFDSVDVNVHPNKLDVRFENGNAIYSLVFEAVSRAISEMDYVSTAQKLDRELVGSAKISTNAFALASDEDDVVIEKKSDKVNKNPFSDTFVSMTKEEAQEKRHQVIETISMLASSKDNVADGFGLGSKLLERISKQVTGNEDISAENYVNDQKVEETCKAVVSFQNCARLIGKVFNTYLLVEIEDDLFVIDQHAAHERILYKKLKAQIDSGDIAIQPLLIPHVLSLSPAEYNLVDGKLDMIRKLGFEIDEFGGGSFKISAIPAVLSDINFDKFFETFLDDNKKSITTISDVIADNLMQAACKAAVKGGDDLSLSEIDKLFEGMSNEKIPLFCPHGRPIAVRIKKTEIEKWFKRIV